MVAEFNARTGKEGGRKEGEEWEKEETRRRSRDKIVNKEVRILVECIREGGWFILNGGARGDEDGMRTYTRARGESVIDYAMKGMKR